MRNSIIQVFNNYGLFGKSVPGAFLLLGVVSFFPLDSLPLAEVDSLSFLNIAALLAILLIAGLTLGQGVHTIADNFEKAFLWFARLLRRFFNWLRVGLINRRNIDLSYSALRTEDDGLRNAAIEWIRRRYWGSYDSLASHRYLFGKWIQWNFAKENDHRWETHSKGPLFEEFAQCYKEKFDIEVQKQTPEDLVAQYTLLTSYLEGSSRTQYRHFQSIYSFCRSMWVVALALSFAYSVTIIDIPQVPDLIRHTPAIFTIAGSFRWIIPILPLLSAVVFFDAAGTYKRHFVEYLMASFIHCVYEDTDIEDASPQSRVDEFWGQ